MIKKGGVGFATLETSADRLGCVCVGERERESMRGKTEGILTMLP